MHPLATEIKFLVDAAAAQRIRDWARAHLTPDPNGGGPFGDQYRTTSLYLDTEQLDTFHRRGSFGRAKYRIRRYGSDGAALFLERKMKTRDYLHKRRTLVSADTLGRLGVAPDAAGETGPWAGQWFQRRLTVRRLHPVCEVAYLRTARVALGNEGPTRLTIDESVQARPAEGMTLGMTAGTDMLDGQCIVEMKYVAAPPALMKRFIEEFALTPKPVSKYRGSVEALGLAGALHA